MSLLTYFQIPPMPEDGQNAWMYVTGIMVLAAFAMATTLGTTFWKVLEDKDKQIAKLAEDGKTCAAELGKTSDSLQKMTDVSERQRQTFADGFSDQKRSLDEILNIIAPRRRDT